MGGFKSWLLEIRGAEQRSCSLAYIGYVDFWSFMDFGWGDIPYFPSFKCALFTQYERVRKKVWQIKWMTSTAQKEDKWWNVGQKK